MSGSIPRSRRTAHSEWAWWPVPDRKEDPDPMAALDAHVALVRALRHHQYPLEDQSAAYQTALAMALDAAATIVVTHQLLDFVLERMRHVPFGEPLRPELLHFPSAFVVLPRPVFVPRDDETNVTPRHVVAAFDMGAWVQAGDTKTSHPGGDMPIVHSVPKKVWMDISTAQDYTAFASDGTLIGNRGVGYFHILSEPAVHQGIQYMREHGDPIEGDYSIRAPLPVYSAGWQYGLTWDPDVREPGFVLTKSGEWERRFWLSLWSTLVEQVEPVAPKIDRPTMRRAQRARRAPGFPEVVVCNLRMLKRIDKDGTERSVRPKPKWTHRWRVIPHDRTLYRGTPQERVVPVKGCIKGPEHAPLIEKDRVYRLAR